MTKLLGSGKKSILVIFAFIVVCAFLVTTLVPSIAHFENSKDTDSTYCLHSNPLLSNHSVSQSRDYVKCTLVLGNNTLFRGNFIGNENRYYPVKYSSTL